MIVNVIVASTFVVQMIGPVCVRYAVGKAGEIGRDVTEDDIIESHTVAEMIEQDVPIIKENTHLDALVDMVKESESRDFCVVNDQGALLGSISIGDLRGVLLERESELNPLIMAKDIAVPATRIISAQRPLKEAIEILRRKELDFLPVVKDEKSMELYGIIHYREVMSEVHKEVLKRRGSA